MDFSVLMRIVVFRGCFPIENYWSIPGGAELNNGTIFKGDVAHPQR